MHAFTISRSHKLITDDLHFSFPGTHKCLPRAQRGLHGSEH